MDDILKLASTLGKRIASDDRAKSLARAQKAFDENLQARQLLADYEQTQHKIAELETAGKPIEPQDKRRLQELHDRVVQNETLKALLRAQADFFQLMTLVSQRIEAEASGGHPQ